MMCDGSHHAGLKAHAVSLVKAASFNGVTRLISFTPNLLSCFTSKSVKHGLSCRFFDLQINKLSQIRFAQR